MEAFRERYEAALHDRKLRSGIYMVTLVTALLILALVIKGPEESGRLIADGSGSIIAINRSSLKRAERYDLSLQIKEAGELIERDVTLTLQANSGGSINMKKDEEDDREAYISAGIDSIISEVEYAKGRRIDLPQSLPDGTALTWKSSEHGSSRLVVIIPLMYISLIALMIAGTARDDKSPDELRKSMLRGLPRFCNQLYLMMNAGLILSDAFDIITGSYHRRDPCDLSPFELELAGLYEATDGHRISTAEVINEFAVRHDVKEMIRIASILTENEKRGSDVVESLARESRYLWDERKVVARESGKMIDTKMSYPLGLLLILLIVITMAPALLSM